MQSNYFKKFMHEVLSSVKMPYFSTISLNVLPIPVSTFSTPLQKHRFKAKGAHQIVLTVTGTKTSKNKKRVEDNLIVIN